MKQNINISLIPLYTITEKWFSIALSQFADKLTEDLISKAEKSNSVTIQSDCFTSLHSLNKSVNDVIPLFINSLAKNFHTLKTGHTLLKKPSDSTFSKKSRTDKLNLIATKDLEENLSFDAAIEKIEKQNHKAFEHLKTRIFALLKNHGEQISKAPISAESILSAFRDSMEIFDFSSEIRIHVYKLFEQFLSDRIAELLEKLNKELINQGILPKIIADYSIKKEKKNSQNPARNTLDKTEHPGEINTPVTEQTQNVKPRIQNKLSDIMVNPNSLNSNNTTIGTIATPPITSSPGEISRQQTSTLNSRHLNLANQLSRTNKSTIKTSAIAEHLPQTNFEEQISSNIPDDTPEQFRFEDNSQLNKLLNHTNRAAINSTSYSSTNNLLSLKQIYADKQQNISNLDILTFADEYDTSTEELIDALVGIQYNTSAIQEYPEAPTLSVRKQIKNNILAHSGKPPETTQLKNKKLYLIDMIEDLFTHIADNKKLSLSAKELFRKLMIPIIHLALVDDTFIDNTTHSARHFLDAFADASLGITDSETNINNPIYLKLKKITTQLDQENKINKSVFTELHNDLKQFVNYRKQQANNSGHSSRSSIKKKIDAIVKHCIKDKNIPKGITLILNKIWKNVMFNIYLDNNCDDDVRERATAFINSLTFSIKPVQTSIEKNRLERLIPIVNHELKAGFIRVNCPKSIKEKIFLYLKNLHHFALSGPSTEFSNNDLSSEPDNITYRNELFENSDNDYENGLNDNDAAAHSNPDKAFLETEALETKSIADDLDLFDQSINTKPSAKIVTSIEEAFIESKESKTTTVKLHQNNKQEINTPEKHSATDFELIRLANNSYKMTLIDDEYTCAAKNITEDSWLEFRFKSYFSRAKITWIEDDQSQYNCLTQNNRVIEISLEALSDSFRQGICSVVESSSIIDEAVNAVSDAVSGKITMNNTMKSNPESENHSISDKSQPR